MGYLELISDSIVRKRHFKMGVSNYQMTWKSTISTENVVLENAENFMVQFLVTFRDSKIDEDTKTYSGELRIAVQSDEHYDESTYLKDIVWNMSRFLKVCVKCTYGGNENNETFDIGSANVSYHDLFQKRYVWVIPTKKITIPKFPRTPETMITLDFHMTQSCNGTRDVDTVAQPTSLLNHLEQLYLSQIYTDVDLQLGDRIFKVHRGIISRSETLDELVTDDPNDEYEILETSAKCFDDLLYFLYTNKVRSCEKASFDLARVARLYKMQELVDICEKIQMKNISVRSAISAYEYGSFYRIPELINTAIKCIVEHKTQFKYEELEPLFHDPEFGKTLLEKYCI